MYEKAKFNRLLVPKGENKKSVVTFLRRHGLPIPDLPKECLHGLNTGAARRLSAG